MKNVCHALWWFGLLALLAGPLLAAEYSGKVVGVSDGDTLTLLVPDGADHLFEFRARHHDEMPASQALEPEVHAGAQDFPFTRAARMCFFHAHDVADGILLFFHHILEAS